MSRMNLARAAIAICSLCIIATSCGTTETSEAIVQDLSGDGTLDCRGGQVSRSVDIEVFGGTEEAVVEAALDRWISQGAEISDVPATESWAAMQDGRDVALAVPERNGDGEWIVHDVQTCDDPSDGPAPIDGELDCADDYIWSEQGVLDPEIPGVATAREAVEDALNPFRPGSGGEIVMLGETGGSIVVDDREQVVTMAFEVPAGGWAVSTITACRGFER